VQRTLGKFALWIILPPVMLFLCWRKLGFIGKLAAIAWTFGFVFFVIIPITLRILPESGDVDPIGREQGNREAAAFSRTDVVERTDDVWSVGNYLENLRASDVLVGDARCADRSFFRWIEDHFTLPEDEDFLVVHEAWTLLSDKARP